VLDPEAWTIGFARRFASYKRGTLLFKDYNRIKALLNQKNKPVQIIIAGKSHPADEQSKKIIEHIDYLSNYQLKHRAVFLDDYSITLSKYLTSGADIWLNTPIFGLEASGTSGMKASANGVIQCTVPDGWAYEVEWYGLGYSLPIDHTGEEMYSMIEKKIVPTFYRQNSEGIPELWVSMMKETVATVSPQFSSTRMVKDYEMLKPDDQTENKIRLAFSKAHANEMWQADTLYGPHLTFEGVAVQTRLIAFIDDASRVCCHAQFFLAENTDTLIAALRSALYKRGVPESLYVDNGSIYICKEITQICARIGCLLCHAPVRDGAAKGKVERFFRTVRMSFLTRALDLCLVFNSSVNAYRRLDPHFEAPNQIRASAVDRGAMVRVPIGNHRSMRTEVRAVAPDANPYLSLYGIFKTGIDGNISTLENLRAGGRYLPDNIQKAIDDFQSSSWIAEILGSDVQGRYAELKQAVANRSPRELGAIVKGSEVQFHHAVYNQSLWNLF